MKKFCYKCEFFKSRQGKGRMGECRVEGPQRTNEEFPSPYPETKDTDWCGRFELNRDKYNSEGRKVRTPKNTTLYRPSGMSTELPEDIDAY